MTDRNTAGSATTSSVTCERLANAPMPTNGALVAQEIDLLDEHFLRLSEQEALKQAQLAAMKQLADQQAERIRLLEQQIAQLEPQQANKPVSE